MSKPTILVIDDENSICAAFRQFFTRRDWTVEICATGAAGIQAYRRSSPDLVFLDVRLPDIDGLTVLNELRAIDPNARIVIITAYGTLETVTQAVQDKAFDYLAKPIDLDDALKVAQQVLELKGAEVAESSETVRRAATGTPIIGASHVIQEVFKRIGLVAQSDSSVLILGETGTGKELVARAIHEYSARKTQPFIAVNCGALPENLVESELFGHEKGAFTGATASRPGKFEAANGGTLFLDEIGELPPAIQVKLLRVLDSQVIERLGSVEPVALNVRILAATNRQLVEEVAANRFRSDLFYRLNVIHIELPLLAERMQDILPLTRHFLAQFSSNGREIQISEAALDKLRQHDWPGNVRELRNAIEHAVVVAAGNPILPDHLPESVGRIRHGTTPCQDPLQTYVQQFVDLDADIYPAAILPLEKQLIELAMRRTNGNQSEAAKLLGVHRNTLRNKIRELGIT